MLQPSCKPAWDGMLACGDRSVAELRAVSQAQERLAALPPGQLSFLPPDILKTIQVGALMHVAACANASFMASILRAAGFGGNAELTHRLAGAVGSAGAGRVAAAGHVRRGAHDALKLTACAHAADGRSASVGAPREKTSGSWQLKRRLGRAPCRVMQQDRVLPSSVVPRLSAPFVFELQPCHADLAHLSASSQSRCSLI